MTAIHPECGAAVVGRGLEYRYGTVTALAGLDLELAQGEVTTLLGPNGAGKSTFVSLLLGLTRLHAGTLTVLGNAPGSLAARRATGAVLQTAALAPQLTVREHLELHSGYYPAARPVAESLHLAGLERLSGRRYDALSGGEQRRVQFALALCGRPRLLVLDEPTVALDVEARRAVWEAVRAVADDGTAVLLTTHHLEEADSLSDRVVLLAAGRVLADGSPARIRERVGAQRVRCRTRLAHERLQALPAVARVSPDGRRVALLTHCAAATLRALLAADDSVGEIEVGGASLEDAVNDLVRQEVA